MDAEIIAVGSELLTPYRQDTNSLFLTEHLNQLGIEVTHKSVVGDDRGRIAEVARIAVGRADLVILTGGLGPTEDDLTREAVADVLGRKLERDPELLGNLQARFAAFRMKMPPNNARQADVVPGAVILPNPNGTAPGQWIEKNYAGAEKVILLLPGPPPELKPMFREHCLERLRRKAPLLFIATRILRLAMMPESACDSFAAPIYKQYPDVQTTILASAGEAQLHLRSRAPSQAQAQARVDQLAAELKAKLGDYVFSTTGESLEQVVGSYLEMRGATLAVAESSTGGLVAERLTSVSGSSRYFLGGVVAYSNELKSSLAGVPPQLIRQHGAVSREVAGALAEGIRRQSKATLGIGVTGIAGPTGGSKEKPVGLVFHALADGGETQVIERTFPGDRERVRWWASQQALDMVRRRLM